MSLKKIIGLVAIILVIVIGFFVFSQLNKKAVEKTPQLDTAVKQIVSSYLISPGSAQFAELIIKKKINTENQYVAFGDVDSQNSLGGLLRSHFFLVIIDKGGDMQNINNWTINQLDLGDNSIIFNGEKYDTPLSLSDLSEEVRTGQKQMEDYYRGLK
jgi:uncharacterized protein YneF (UPF0154 family)